MVSIIDATPSGKTVRLLSCNNTDAAELLSSLTKNPFYASDGWVDLYKTGAVRSGDDFYLFEKGVKKTSQKINKNTEAVIGAGVPVRLGEVVRRSGDLVEFPNIRAFLGNSRTKQYLNNQQLYAFDAIVRSSHPDVLKYMNEMDEFDFAEMVRGYRDLINNNKAQTFIDAVKSIDAFNGQYGWLPYWKLTPSIKYGITTIDDLRIGGKLRPTGNATIQLGTLQAFTSKGDFINVPMRYNKSYLGEYASKGFKNVTECLDELRKVAVRNFAGKTVLSGKTFSKVDFESKFINGIGKQIEYESFISTTTKQSVAEGFTELTTKWAGDGEKIAVIQRIVSKDGVYIDDLSDWGANLGSIRHGNEKLVIQVQDEVLLMPSKLKQTAEPIPIMENGVHKTIPYMENGVQKTMKVYYVDFIQL